MMVLIRRCLRANTFKTLARFLSSMAEPVVTVNQGKLLGKINKNIDGGPFYSFQGIPYAKPPIGDLRFCAPQLPQPWSGTWDATKEGSECYARDMVLQTIVGSEDCLSLNVFTPQLPSENPTPKPVMVWIHGGGFTAGSSKTNYYGPDYLLTQDIVLVTINYRLGVLGFLSLDDSSLEVPGNAGLKDMVMALKWVQQNVEKFGGDPKNVTIFGESAGGAAVHLLVLSPMAKGLFHRAIMQSGSAINGWVMGSRVASQLADVLELKTKNEKEILEHLRSLPVEKLFEASEKFGQVPMSSGLRTFCPIVEKPSTEEAFLNEDPFKLISSGNYNQVPLLFSFTTMEGMLMELIKPPGTSRVPDDFQTVVPQVLLGVKQDTDECKAVAKKIKEFYFGNDEKENVLEKYYTMHTDNDFFREIRAVVEHHAATSKAPVYFCRISVESELNIFKKIMKVDFPGVSHGDDIGFLFKTMLSPEITPGSLEETTMRRFVRFWTSFAKSGNPNSMEKDMLTNVDWKPVKKGEINFLDIGQELKMGTNPEPRRMAFWTEIFKNHPFYQFIVPGEVAHL